ncbi:glycosyltransferase [uncultured Bacteroides sp.]|uniref:glycosyltransferase family 2 protein n=1 Tax=uncultured Bacteroides sp. TaxID=162156 RepID=UPI0026090083|nr:glycosyltransferase [uncultured Bacteroides sp.]
MYPKLITVIIPVYNTEQYLTTCLDSLLQQTFQDFEVILIDDGSKDKTGEICDEYSSRFPKIKVIHQKNRGVSAARKIGLEMACGKYIISVDADDWMEEDMLESLFFCAEQNDADITFCDYDKVYKDRIEIVDNQLEKLDNISYLRAQMGGGMWGTYWNKLIKTSLYREHDIYPIIGVQMWDDYIFTNGCVIYAEKIAYCRKVLYHYNQMNIGAMPKSKSAKNYQDIVTVISSLFEQIIKARLDDILEEEMIKMKLFAKSYLLYPPYKNYDEWLNLYPETNKVAILFASNDEKKKVLQYILNGSFWKADLFQVYYSYKEKISRHLRKRWLLQY